MDMYRKKATDRGGQGHMKEEDSENKKNLLFFF